MKRKYRSVLKIRSDYSNFTKDLVERFIPSSHFRQRQGYKMRMASAREENGFCLFKVKQGPGLYFMILEMFPRYEKKNNSKN